MKKSHWFPNLLSNDDIIKVGKWDSLNQSNVGEVNFGIVGLDKLDFGCKICETFKINQILRCFSKFEQIFPMFQKCRQTLIL